MQVWSLVGKMLWRRKCHPTPVFLPGKSHGQWRLAGYSPWGCEESDMTEQLSIWERVHTQTHTHIYIYQFSSVQSVAQSCLTVCDPMDCRTPGLPVYHQLPEFTQTHVHCVSEATQPSHSLPTPSPPTFNLSQHQALFKWVNSSHQVSKVLEFHLNISPSNGYSGLISFRMDWFDLLAVQGTLQSLLQHHSSKPSILWCSAIFIVQLSHLSVQFSSFQSLSRVWLFATPWTTARQTSLPITISRISLRLMSIESVMPSGHLILCRPLLLLPPSPPSIRVFSNESTLCIRWPKYWSFSFSIIPSKEIPGLISFRMDWLDLFAVQGTLKSPLQHHTSKASIL